MAILAFAASIGFFVLIIVLAVRYTKKVNNRKAKLFSEFADKHGLQFSETKFMLTRLFACQGKIGELEVHVYEKMEGSGKNRSVVTRASIGNTPFDFEFKIGKEHIFSKAGKMLGVKDIEFNDPEFDKKFLLKSDHEEKFRQLLNHSIQAELKELKNCFYNAIRHNNKTMTYAFYGPLANEKQFQMFEKILNFMIKLTKQKIY